MSGTQIFIILIVIIGILALGLVGGTYYFFTYKKKVHKQAQQNQIYLCKKMEVIVKMLEIIADPQRDRNTAIAESHKLAEQVVGNAIAVEEKIKEETKKEETSNKEIMSKMLDLIQQLKGGK